MLNSVFLFFSYALLQVPAGILGDKIGKKKSAGARVYSVWRFFTAVTGWVKSWYMLLFARVVTGAGEGDILWPAVRIVFRADPEKSSARWVARLSIAEWPLASRWV
ncbi:MFS transporter [Escherichia coli]